MSKKVLCFFMAFSVFCFILSGCGDTSDKPSESSSQDDSGDGETTSTVSGSETDDPYGALSEKTSLTIGRSEDSNVTYESGENSADNYIVKYIADSLNVEYVQSFSVDSSTYETKVGMAIASGDMPDVMTVTEAQLRQLAQADAIEDLTEFYDRYASDNLKDAYATTDGVSFEAATFDGKLMALANISPGADGIPLLFVRGDWMDELGLEAPKTLDDIVNIAKTFMEKNPGGNVTTGITVSQDITSSGGNTYGLDALFALYDSYPKLWVTDDSGELVYGSTTDSTKIALTQIRSLVESGIIDSSFVVRDSDQCQEIVTSGQSGIFFGAWWNATSPLQDMSKTDDSIYWNSYVAPLTEDGTYNTHMMSPSSGYLVVKKGCSDAIKEAVIKTANYQFDIDQDQGVSIKSSADVSYSWTMMPFSLLLSRYDDKEAKAQAVMDVINGDMSEDELVGEQIIWYDSYKNVLDDGLAAAIEANNASGYGFTNGAYTISSNDDIINKVYAATYSRSESMDKVWATLEKLENETFLKILSGDAQIDEFDSFVEQWKSLGGDTVTTELKDMLK